MINEFSRTELILGAETMKKLSCAHVAVFGIGGVGGYVCEALARSGIGRFDLIDNDTVSVTNINRQIIATHSTVGRYKTEIMRERMLDINPDVQVNIHNCFYLPDTADFIPFDGLDYIIDAIDTVTAKLDIAVRAKALGIPLISSMGTGNKLDPSRLRITDISKTTMDPLARIMRKELRQRGIDHLKVVFSDEEPLTPLYESEEKSASRRAIPGSTAFVPSSAGLLIASEVIRDLAGL